ncbi:hypothetical protein [Streptomyces sp. NPDC050564]|uniref:hypothetical protein n=1 Tax=Streptomyces sp. NPDC050564 TaxID=3365631 RepID=UPI0037A33D15
MAADSFVQQVIASLARRTPVLDEPVPGHGKSALLAEDRPDFERTVDEVLIADAPKATERLTAEQLRTMVLAASNLINTAAATEYAHYVQVRERGGRSHKLPAQPSHEAPAEPSGAGIGAILAVLTPALFGTAALIFLVVGYAVGMANPKPAVAATLLTTGWTFLAATAASVLAVMIALLLAALRSAAGRSAPDEVLRSQNVAQARDAWRQALRREGIEPFLREARRAASTRPHRDQMP